MCRSKKQRRVQTADEKLYGVFAEEASSDEEGGRRFGKKGKKADYSRPVSFVSTGVGMGSADAKPQPVPDNAGPQYIKVEDAKGVKVEDNGQKGFGGLSFRLSSDATAGRGSMTGLDSHTGLGATNGAAAHSSSSRSNPSFVHGHHGGAPADYDEEEEELVLPNAFGRQ
jgi:tuftelin-interacting protein 11